MNYLSPDCRLTLREAIAELRAAEPAGEDAAETLAEELRDDIDVHDVIHVLFGCPTTIAGEVMAHVWTLLGTKVPLSALHRVNQHEDHRSALRQIGHGRLLGEWLRSLPSIGLSMVRAGRMNKKLDVAEIPQLLERTLLDIRQDYGIVLGSICRGGDGERPAGALLRHPRRA